MGSITPNNNEYNLISGFIEEALGLLGQECKIYTITNAISETSSDSIIYYNEPIISTILFEDDLRDVKLKSKSWDKETDLDIYAYISLNDLDSISKNCIIEITPTFYNKESKFLITDIFGQVNTTYARVRLVPYRKSLRTDTDNSKDIETTETVEGIIQRKSILKR